jgi:hypothetical protein
MIYGRWLSVPANTSMVSPSYYDLKCSRGLLYQAQVYFPPGPSGLLGLKVHDEGFQLYPSVNNEWFRGDNLLLAFGDRYFLASAGAVLRIYTYNLDDTYAHEVWAGFGIVSEEAFIASFLPSLSMDRIGETIAELIASQTAEKAARREALHEASQGL